jgi:hypothetical protein
VTDSERIAAVKWKAVVRFAAEPDDPRKIAEQLAPLVAWEQLAVRDGGDLEVVGGDVQDLRGCSRRPRPCASGDR